VSRRRFVVAGRSLDRSRPGDSPDRFFLADRRHMGTLAQAELARKFILAVNARFGAGIEPLRASEMLGLVDTPQKGREAGHACRRADIDLLIIYVTTYALSSTVLPMVQRAQVPVLVLNIQPEAAIDYEAFNRLPDRTAMTGEWLAFCSAQAPRGCPSSWTASFAAPPPWWRGRSILSSCIR